MAAATLDEFFPGRVQLCFGIGAPRDLEAAGVVTEQPLRTLREALELTRELLSGQTVNFQGQRFKILGRRLAVGPRPIPLWLAASGPQTLELAGERADEVIISAGTSPAFIGWALDHVHTGEKRAGRAVKKAALVLCSVSEDERVSNDRLRRRLGYVLRGAHHARNLELAGSKLDQTELSQAFAKEDWNSFDALVTDDVRAPALRQRNARAGSGHDGRIPQSRVGRACGLWHARQRADRAGARRHESAIRAGERYRHQEVKCFSGTI